MSKITIDRYDLALLDALQRKGNATNATLGEQIRLSFRQARAGIAGTALALIVGIAPAMHAFFGTPSASLLALAILQLAGYKRKSVRKALAA